VRGIKKIVISLYGTFAYLVGLAGLTAFMLYMGSWSFLPIHINSGVAHGDTVHAVIINVLIVVLFGLHHSIAARSSFKQRISRFVPAAIERSTYVLISGIFMFAICLYWQPLAGTLWVTDNTIIVYLLKAIHVLGWLVLVVATFEIDHFHLMGLKQSFTMNTAEDGKLKEYVLYRIVRHPIQTGVLMGIWSTAHMSMTQFMLSVSLTLYIFIGLYYEEKSLIAQFGDTYLDYKERVPGVIPFRPVR
jgi:protein-S-isoprenylcysteine O-methyltransferase Ste14